jgi:hypothetical protein
MRAKNRRGAYRVRQNRLPYRGVERLEDRLLLSARPLAAGVLLQAGGAPIYGDTPGHTTPTAADWDGDGKKDLLMGQFNQGNIWFYSNQGTDAAPSFGSGTKIKCAGSNITTSYG